MNEFRKAAEKRRILWEEARALRQALTPAEEALWQRLRRHQVLGLHFQSQYVVGPFIADFYCRAAQLVVEVDGGVHRGQRGRDAERDAYLAGRGLRVLRFRNEEVLRDLENVVRSIAFTAEHAAPEPPPESAPSSGRRRHPTPALGAKLRRGESAASAVRPD